MDSTTLCPGCQHTGCGHCDGAARVRACAQEAILHDVDLRVLKGQLVMVVGQVRHGGVMVVSWWCHGGGTGAWRPAHMHAHGRCPGY